MEMHHKYYFVSKFLNKPEYHFIKWIHVCLILCHVISSLDMSWVWSDQGVYAGWCANWSSREKWSTQNYQGNGKLLDESRFNGCHWPGLWSTIYGLWFSWLLSNKLMVALFSFLNFFYRMTITTWRAWILTAFQWRLEANSPWETHEKKYSKWSQEFFQIICHPKYPLDRVHFRNAYAVCGFSGIFFWK